MGKVGNVLYPLSTTVGAFHSMQKRISYLTEASTIKAVPMTRTIGFAHDVSHEVRVPVLQKSRHLINV